MKKRNNYFLALCVFVLLAFSTYAQEAGMEFGVVSSEELKMTSYANDKDAEALVLFDIAVSKFIRTDEGFEIVFERVQRIKVLSEAGLNYAEFEVPFYQSKNIYEKVRDIKGITFNLENGSRQISKLDPSTCFEEKQNEYWKLMKIPMPDVKVGSVIDLKYSVTTQDIFKLRDWEFQRRIPTVYSKYQVWLVPFYEYTYILQGAGKFSESDWYVDKGLTHQLGNITYNYVVSNYVMKDVPAFKGEEFISSYSDYIMKLDFQLAKINSTNGTVREIQTTWEKMIKEYNKDQDFGKYIKKSQKLYADLLIEDIVNLMSDSAKMHHIIDVVKQNVSWDGYYARRAKGSPKMLLQKKSGNVASVNLFLCGLLREAGFEAYPVLLSTRSHGRVYTKYPFSHFLNYVIVAVKSDGGYILTDATSPLTINHRIPPRCINDLGLVFKEGEELEWVPLSVDFTSGKRYDYKIAFSSDHLEAITSVEYTEYDAYDMRLDYVKDSTQFEKDIDERYDNCEVELLTLENLNEPAESLKYSYKLETSPEKINDKIFITPFFADVISENPLKQSKRNHPVDMIYPKLRTYHAEIKIPEGYALEFFPEPARISNKDFYLQYLIKKRDDIFVVDFQYVFLKGKYPASDYHKLKFYFNEIVKKANEKYVFVKKDLKP